jgi:hypothetical protein
MQHRKIISSTEEDEKGENANGWRIEEVSRSDDEMQMAEDEQKRNRFRNSKGKESEYSQRTLTSKFWARIAATDIFA